MSTPHEAEICYLHPQRRAGVTCQRCGRHICGVCMHQADVGFHCPSCVGPVVVGHQRRRRWAASPSLASAHRDPIAIRVVIALNAAAFLYALSRGASLAGSLGDVGVDFGLVGFGCKAFIGQMCIGPLGVDEGEWWRLATSAFLHAGLLHIGFNMFLAWMLGNALERLHGPVRFLGLYTGSLAAGSLGVLLMAPTTLTVGASGAVFGLMGATVVHQYRRGINPWSSGIGTLVVVNLLFTFGRPGISIGGHLGGLLGGAVLAWLVDESDRRGLPRRLGTAMTCAFALACFAGGIWAAANWYDPLLG
ncbi:MAG: rhomboid family intramembrane serine protease [Acidimicrobiales bacterium]|nr:rhomboid family intramembrane serine protease [Acidimicrobiales bacterium]